MFGAQYAPRGLPGAPGSELGLAPPALRPAKTLAGACAAGEKELGPASRGSWRPGPHLARPPGPPPPPALHVPGPIAQLQHPSPVRVTMRYSDPPSYTPYACRTCSPQPGTQGAGTPYAVDRGINAPVQLGSVGTESSSQRGQATLPSGLHAVQVCRSQGNSSVD